MGPISATVLPRVTHGASTATLSVWEDGQLVTKVVESELAERLIEEYQRQDQQDTTSK
jgi:hypothetical protein